jgi:hypothetical protein
LIDCGNPDFFVGFAKRAARSEADLVRMEQLVSAMRADYVFALKGDEVVFNPYKGGDAGDVTPIEYIMNEFGKDVPALVSNDARKQTSASDG